MPVIVPPTTSKKAGKPTFLFGNYKSYYGYRTEEDPRMKHLKKEWFYGKRCLDIGCNTGRLFGYRSMMGVDIDGSLIRKAESIRMSILERNPDKADDKFPHNLTFKTENFIDATHDEFFDTILSFSITKWIHLNWGDEGIRRFFRNINACLRPGGLLLLEPQEFSSYKRRSHLTPQFRANYKAIVLKPRHFADFLAAEYGFEHLRSEEIEHTSKGFARPILVFRKPVAEFVKQGDWVPPATEPAGQAEADGEAEVSSSVAVTEADSESIERQRRKKEKKQRKRAKEGAEAKAVQDSAEAEAVQEGAAVGGAIEETTKKAKKHKRRAHDEEVNAASEAVGGEEKAPEDLAHKKRAKRQSREHGEPLEAADGAGQSAQPESAPAVKKEKRHKHKPTRETE